jgi:hypothetical protein
VAFEVVSTPIADRAIAGLRGRRRRAFDQFEEHLASDGCQALGYRLTGEHPLSSLCVKHLRGTDRVVVAFVEDTAWILLVGPHEEGDRAADIYSRLYELLDLEPPRGERTKPPCCLDSGEGPQVSESETDAFSRRS